MSTYSISTRYGSQAVADTSGREQAAREHYIDYVVSEAKLAAALADEVTNTIEDATGRCPERSAVARMVRVALGRMFPNFDDVEQAGVRLGCWPPYEAWREMSSEDEERWARERGRL